MKQGKLSFKTFSKKFWKLFLCLFLILIGGVSIFCLIFFENLNDISAWASMIAGIISYIGSSILGIFVFYHSWVQVIRQDELEDISVLISASGCEHSPLFLFDEDSIRKQYPHVVSRHLSVETQTKFEINSFFKVTMTNCNYFLPIQLEITELYYLDDNDEFKKIYPIKIRSKVDLAVPLDYKEKTELLIGIPKEVFLLNRYKDHSVFYISA